MNRNKLTKKALAGIMSAAMLAAMPVYAENEESKDMTVEYLQDTTYTLSIPESITLSSTAEKKVKNIGVSAVNTTPAEKVKVKIKSGITNNQVELVRQDYTGTKVVSDVTDKDGNKVSNGFVVAEFQDMSTVPVAGANTNILNFSAVKDSAGGTVKAGSYSGTIVFEADVVDRIETPETF
ncbi:MAG: hypothetical protein Q4C91_23950 [Eubacteriales bacterium]|nr:hypothetical protein [Eubacteriales bacterium]